MGPYQENIPDEAGIFLNFEKAKMPLYPMCGLIGSFFQHHLSLHKQLELSTPIPYKSICPCYLQCAAHALQLQFIKAGNIYI